MVEEGTPEYLRDGLLVCGCYVNCYPSCCLDCWDRSCRLRVLLVLLSVVGSITTWRVFLRLETGAAVPASLGTGRFAFLG